MSIKKRKTLTAKKKPSAQIRTKSAKLAARVRKQGSSKTEEEKTELETSFLNRMKDASRVKIKKSSPDY